MSRGGLFYVTRSTHEAVPVAVFVWHSYVPIRRGFQNQEMCAHLSVFETETVALVEAHKGTSRGHP